MSKANKKFNLFGDEQAVSPVIGTILMVAVTVVLAAIIAGFIFGLVPGLVPSNADAKPFQLERIEGTDGDIVTVTNMGLMEGMSDIRLCINGWDSDVSGDASHFVDLANLGEFNGKCTVGADTALGGVPKDVDGKYTNYIIYADINGARSIVQQGTI